MANYRKVKEGKVEAFVPYDKKISKDLPVFFNPIMELNRSVSVALLKTVKIPLQIGLPLAGTGIRAIRLLTELTNIQSIEINDLNEDAVNLIKKNIELNEHNLNCDEIEISNLDANLFLLESKGFDYIDIDPFGSPNPFLDTAIKRLARKGILAITATDTGALSGTYPKACQRKYWARPLKNELMHEIGIRILIRKVQLMGAQNDKALTPILSYSKDHYMRVFFTCEKGKEKVAAILKQHFYLLYCTKCLERKFSKYNNELCSCKNNFEYAGPLWSKNLQDNKMIKKIKHPFIKELSNESESSFFYDIHTFAKKLKLKQIKKTDEILKSIKKLDINASLTHFKENCIKTNIKIKEFKKIIQ